MSGNNTLGTFEWPDISHPKKWIGDSDSDSDKDKRETKEKETQDDEGGSNSNEGMIELKSVFQSYSKLEACATK